MNRCLLPLLLLAPAAGAQVANLGPLGEASQSSTVLGGYPAYANDGNRDGVYLLDSVTHTGPNANEWWQVDWVGNYELHELRLYNRSDCCAERLSRFTVTVTLDGAQTYVASLHQNGTFVPAGGVEIIPLPAGTRGNRVRVQVDGLNNEGNGYLSLAEVEVYGSQLGTQICGPAAINSTGMSAEIRAVGSAEVGSGDMGLVTLNQPKNNFGYFLVSQTTGQANVGSGVLCLGGTIGRFTAQIQLVSFNGRSMGIPVDTSALPLSGMTAVQPGETWYFQAWFRDGFSSNLTDAVAVTFS